MVASRGKSARDIYRSSEGWNAVVCAISLQIAQENSRRLDQSKRGKQCTVSLFYQHEVFQNKMEKLEIPKDFWKLHEAAHHVHTMHSVTVHVIITHSSTMHSWLVCDDSGVISPWCSSPYERVTHECSVPSAWQWWEVIAPVLYFVVTLECPTYT